MTDAPTLKPLPCPFCGGKATIHDMSKEGHRSFMVACDSRRCKVSVFTGDRTEAEAIARWNERTEEK